MASAEPLFCPECEGEFVATALACPDCGVALVTAAALEQREVESLPPASELVCVRAASVGWAQALSGLLAEEGIPHRIEAASEDGEEVSRRPGVTLPYGVYVRAQDVEKAREIDTAFMKSQIPDLPDDHELAAPDAEGCPACGETLAPDASECPECGLALIVE
jgi:ssDNA-binding Zn-finger/Zn-ribbon topoisomerase 1